MPGTSIFEHTASLPEHSHGHLRCERRMLGSMRSVSPLLVPVLAVAAAFAQTADRTATPTNPATTAPAAEPGTYPTQNGELIVAPGLKIPNGNVPWALDTVNNQQVLVPIHHTSLKTTDSPAELEDTTQHTPLHSATPAFFVHSGDLTENTGDSGHGTPTGWALLPVVVEGSSRTVVRPAFADVNSATVCAPPVICTQAESLPDGWLRITPKSPLEPGEYALLPVQRATPESNNPLAYDFTVDVQQPPAKDTVSPGQNLDTNKKKGHHSVQ